MTKAHKMLKKALQLFVKLLSSFEQFEALFEKIKFNELSYRNLKRKTE